MVFDSATKPRRMRHSVYSSSSNQVISALRSRIKSIYYESIDQAPEPSVDSPVTSSYIDSTNPSRSPLSPTSKISSKSNLITDILTEQILVNRKPITIRRVYIINNKYKIGWVVDCDLNCCMVCWKDFAWYLGRAKHHCRACGSLVCHDCSPYITNIPNLSEEKGSRVCRNCFGLKPGIFTPPQKTSSPIPSSAMNNTLNSNLFGSPADPPASSKEDVSGNVRRRSIFSQRSPQFNPKLMTEEAFIEQYLEKVKELEKDQLPKYLESYLIMREIIPLDIYKSSIPKLIARGLPEKIAHRIWNTRILWLICTHKDDILKIHLADFRSKYFYDGLDIVEMRAIWHILPEWKKDSDNMLEKGKAEWKEGFRSKLDDLIYKEMKGTLSKNLIRNPAYLEDDSENPDEEGNYYQLHLFDPHLPLVPRFHRSASFMQDAVHSPVDSNSRSPLKTSDPFRQSAFGLDSTAETDEFEDEMLYLLNETEPEFNRSPSSSISSNASSVAGKSKSKLLTVNERKTVYFDNIDRSRQQLEEEKHHKYRTFFEEIQDDGSPFPITQEYDDDMNDLMDSNSPMPPRGTAPNVKSQSLSEKTPPLSQSYSSRPLSLNLNAAKSKEFSLNSLKHPSSMRYSYSPSSTISAASSFNPPRHSLGPIETGSNQSTPSESYFRNSTSGNRPLLSRTSSFRSNSSISPYGAANGSFFSPPTTSFNSVSGLCSLNSANNTPMLGSESTDRNSEAFYSPYTPLAGQINLKMNTGALYSPSIDSIMLNDEEESSPSSRRTYFDSEDELPYKTPLTQPQLTTGASSAASPAITPSVFTAVTPKTSGSPDRNQEDSFVLEEEDVDDEDLDVEVVTDEFASFVPFQTKDITSSSNSVASCNSSISAPPQVLGSRQEIKDAIQQCNLSLLKKLLNGHSLSLVLVDEPSESSGFTTTSTSEEITSSKASLKDYEKIYWLLADRLATVYTEDEEEEGALEAKASPIITMILFLIDEELIPIDSVNLYGKSLLHLAVEVEVEALGRELIKRGANILLKDRAEPPMSPLAYAMAASIVVDEEEDQESLAIFWLLDEFQSTGREKKLIFFAPNDQKLEFLSLFLYYGFASKFQKLLKENPKISALLTTVPAGANTSYLQDLFVKCQGNFEAMKEPVETFEVLVSLGAEL